MMRAILILSALILCACSESASQYNVHKQDAAEAKSDINSLAKRVNELDARVKLLEQAK